MLKTLFKFSFAILLCAWLVHNGKLDFGLISQALNNGYLWILGVLLLSTRLFVCSLRFKTLLDTKAQRPTSYLKIFSFDAISNLFSLLIPAGDLVRFLYYKNLGSEFSSGMVVAFITLDRVIGLMGLMGLVSFISLMRLENLSTMSPQILSLISLNALIFAGLCVFMLFFFSKWFPKKKISSMIISLAPNSPDAQKVFLDILGIDLNFKTFSKCFFLSLINHAIVFGSFLLFIIPFLPANTSYTNLITILPIGFIGSALPISPGGLGVGHVLFDNLFKLIQVYDGASLYNLYFIGNILVCLVGLIPYLFERKKIAPSKIG